MRRALELAALGLGKTSPNPVVGAVVVDEHGSVVGEGFHEAAGKPHAEVFALDAAGLLPASSCDAAAAQGAARRASSTDAGWGSTGDAGCGSTGRGAGHTLYVTLEPCCTHGRTPPCTDAIIAAGVSRVVVAARDPNPRVSGEGLSRLGAAGIEIAEGVLEAEARRQNEVFFKWITTGTPFVTAKWAMSLDGRIASAHGRRTAITGEKALRRVHELRAIHDAVMVGSGTVLADDPELTVRLAEPANGRQPVRVVADSDCATATDSKLAATAEKVSTLVATTSRASEERRQSLAALGVEVAVIEDDGGRVDLDALLRLLGERQVTSVLLEAGGRLTASMLEAGLVDKVIAFTAPLLLGHGPSPIEAGSGNAEAARVGPTPDRRGSSAPIEQTLTQSLTRGAPMPLRLTGTSLDRLGEDIMITGYPVREE
ncbi:MAG: bifunctional diaminohydroxyphosphoribosylaminopyrimidine deaminase/5-amino-6-(5-phosphoribosylamino)uracil reductase RibD [Actinobacteria bacterium]|nr:MAG: bifunctional diaminohydroxyphosphoribosylaminopyrimidine deaminase/5-amino-6-(5-phosphoribosylamino)uracil reductase RibD [Actinomycetota bacterium]